MDEPKLVSKGEFATLLNVSAGRVSQLLSSGKLPADVLVGEGRRALIDVDKAMLALDQTLDLVQRTGLNGKARITRPATDETTSSNDPLRPMTVDDELKREALVQRQAETRRILRGEALEAGDLVSARDARVATDKAVTKMVAAIDQALSEMAIAVAAEYKTASRDVEIILKRVWREKRVKQSAEFAAEAAELPAETEMAVELQ